MAGRDNINFLLLAELVVIVIVAAAFLFYWNRLFGWFVAFIIRTYTWRKHNAYISIESLQISPLAGRVAFKQLEYHSSNLSFRALHGHVTFRYWKLRVRQESDSESTNVKRNRLPCRISVYAEGVEMFVFNRTPAYDGIVERMKKYEQAQQAGADASSTKGAPDEKPVPDTQRFGARLRRPARARKDTAEQIEMIPEDPRSSASSDSSPRKNVDTKYQRPKDPKPIKIPTDQGVNWFREMLPMEIRIIAGSIILGSDATPMLLIGDFKSAEGTLEVTDSRSICDYYKMIVNLNFEAPTILMRTNVDYSGPLLAHGKKAYDELYKQDPNVAKEVPSKLSAFFNFHELAKRFAFLRDPKFSSPPVTGLPHDKMWKGLARYRLQDENTVKPRKREEREYAKVTTLLDAPALDLTYFADSPGPVPTMDEAEMIDEMDEFGNVELPPEYGIDIAVHGGTIKYGPWADRQRDALQKAFAPAIFFDSDAKPRLKPGDTRVHTALLLNITLTEETTLRIPTREPSKDWSFDNAPGDVERRYGWLDVIVGPDSSITYTQSQLATKHGYDAMLVLHLDSLSIASSVNLETFIVSKTCRVSVTMPTPLRWDAQRDWGLDIALDTIDVTLLRDHIQLISDLARDWSSGAVGDFHHFVPNHYNFRVTLLNYAVHLYLNDFNIVNRPRSREDNAFMDVTGPAMTCYIAVAATQYRPEFSVVPFSVTTNDARVNVCLPVWDTHRSFGKGDTIEIGKIGQLTATGNYRYYAVPHPDHQETLTLHLEARGVVYKMLGWSLRRFFCIKDNYFGSFTQFTTMQEFLERFDHDPESVGDPVEEKYRPGRSDPFSAQVTMNVEESLILLSDQIYDCVAGLALPVPQLQMALKSTDQYLDLSLDALPTYVVMAKDLQGVYNTGVVPSPSSRETIFIEGINVKAHRLFGPQPRATTYLCIWEINVPRLAMFSSPEMQGVLQSVRQALVYNFQDFDNAPAAIYVPKTPPDVTFLKVELGDVSVMVYDKQIALSVSIPGGVNIDTSTWATRSCQAAVGVVIPRIKVDLLSQTEGNHNWASHLSINTDIGLNIFNAPDGWHDHVVNQQKFLRQEDGPTRRIAFMYDDSGLKGPSHVHGQYLPDPCVPEEKYSETGSSLEDSAQTSSERPDSSSLESQSDSGTDLAGARSRSRARSWQTARQDTPERPLSTDESDPDSDASETTASLNDSPNNEGLDLPSALARGLSQLRGFHHHMHTSDRASDHSSEKNTGSTTATPISLMAEGRLISLALGRVYVDAKTSAVLLGAQLQRSLLRLSETPEKLLDNLLLWQIAPLFKIVENEPLLLDVRVPQTKVHIDCNTTAVSTALDLTLDGFYSRFKKEFGAHGESSQSDLEMGIKHVNACISSLQRLDGETLLVTTGGSHLSSLPYRHLDVSVTDLELGIFTSSPRMTLRHSSGHSKINFVDTVVQVVSLWTDTVLGLAQDVSRTIKRDRPYTALLFQICQAAEAADITYTIPAFISETAYGLHVQDSRSIRRDIGWLVLARLRHWFQNSSPADICDDISREEMAHRVVLQLAEYDDAIEGDLELISRQPFVEHAFQSDLASSPATQLQEDRRQVNAMIFCRHLQIDHHGQLLDEKQHCTSSVVLKAASIGFHRAASQRLDLTTSNTRILAAVQTVRIDAFNSLLPLAQRIRDMETPSRSRPLAQDNGRRDTASSDALTIDVVCDDAEILVAAAGLKARLAIDNHHSTFSGRQEARVTEASTSRHRHHSLVTSSAKIEVAVLQPRTDSVSAADLPLGRDTNDRLVISVLGREHRMYLDHQKHLDRSRPQSCHILFGLERFEVDSRPQLRAFLTFAKEWRAEHSPSYERYFRSLARSASANDGSTKSSAPCSPKSPAIVHLDLSLRSGHIQVRAAKAVWLRWDWGKIFATQRCSNRTVRFGVNIAPQLVGAYSSPKRSKDASKDASAASLRLPSVSAKGLYKISEKRPQVSTSIQFGFFTGVVKPAMLDRLLSLHQRLAQDIEELVTQYTAKSGDSPAGAIGTPDLPLKLEADGESEAIEQPVPMRIDVRCNVEGVRFGLRADDVATTLLFEALSLAGQASNVHSDTTAMSWRAKVNHFGLSLGHFGTGAISMEAQPTKQHRSAYMVLDVDVQEIPSVGRSSSRLNIYLNKVHTVMHIAALSELSDLVNSWQSDLHILRDNHKTEMAEVKSTTTRIFKKLETGDKSGASEASWLTTRLLSVNIAALGIAIPLSDSPAVSGHDEKQGNAALLFSIASMDFMNRRNETARFRMQRMSLQFVSKFDHTSPDHFSGDFHPSLNRMSLPSLESEAQMASEKESWTLSAHSDATDFKLSVAPDVVDGVYKLIDLYDQGRERFLDFEKNYRSEVAQAETQDSVAVKYEDEMSPVSPRTRQRLILRMSFTFNSGIVELHRVPSNDDIAQKARSSARRSANWLDVFQLPTISLWTDFAGAEYDQLAHTVKEISGAQLIISLAVHESRNILRPTILPFFVELANRIGKRARSNDRQARKDRRQAEVSTSSEPLTAALSEQTLQLISSSRSHLDIRVSLRIDRSELRLSCAPDSNAYVDLKWESGGFLATTTMGKDSVSTLAGSISGVTSSLSHEFAERGHSCIEAGAKDMAFSVTFCPGEGPRQSGISVVFDTQLSGQFRLESFSAWLIFISVWVTNAPQLDVIEKLERRGEEMGNQTTPAETTQAGHVGHIRAARKKIAVAVLVRFRSIDFDANVSVTRAHLEITPILVRSTSDGEKTEVDIRVGTTKISAQGDISGNLESQSLVFNTMRRSSRASSDVDATVLSMAIEGGDLSGSLFLADTNILRFHLEPAQVSLADDWQSFTQDLNSQVYLSFTVKAGLFQGVLRLLTIPRLLGNLYSIIDLAESQSVIASQRSEIFKNSRTRRQVEAPQVAAVILQSAAKKVTTAAASASNIKTAQTMRFDLAGMDVGLFNEDYDQGHIHDFYRFVVGKVEADLKRHLSLDDMPTRGLGLLVSFVRWDYSDGARVAAIEKSGMSAGQLIEGSTRIGRSEVASLPVMTLVMNSVEYPSPPVLDFDFDLTWGETDGDVKILPNFFEQAYIAFRKLLKGLDEQESVRSRRMSIELGDSAGGKPGEKHRFGKGLTVEEMASQTQIDFRERDPSKAERLPIPRLKMLGEGTTDMAKLVPKIRSGVKELPKLSHRFVTLPLEEGMDLLLKLYEKQLPERPA